MEDETRTIEPTELDDIALTTTDEDDVEAHGLKEMAVGLSVAATIGGAAAAVGTQALQPQVKLPGFVQQAVSDANELAGNAADGATEFAQDSVGSTRDFAGGVAGDAIDMAGNVASTTISTVNQKVNQNLDRATEIADGALSTAGSHVDTTFDTAGNTRDMALDLTGDVASTASTVAGNTARTAKEAATDAAIGTTKTAIEVVGYARSVVGGWSMDVKVLGGNVHAGGDALAPSGTVTVTDSKGNVVTSATLKDGKCTLHLQGAGADASYTLNYGGDLTFATSILNHRVPSTI